MRVLLALSCVLVTLAVVEARPQTGVFGFFSNLGDEISDVGDVVEDGVSDYGRISPVRDHVDDVRDTIGGFYWSDYYSYAVTHA